MRQALAEGKTELTKLYTNEGQKEQRSLISPLEILCGVFWPTFIFGYIGRTSISKLRYHHYPFVIIVTIVLPLLINAWWTRNIYKRIRQGILPRRWKLVLCIVLWFAIFAAILRGETLFWRYSRSYYQFQDMASYVNISPSTDRGQTYMDAGQVYFKEGSRVEVSKAMAFQEDQIYCVAPIVRETLDSKGKPGIALSGDDGSGSKEDMEKTASQAGGNQGNGALKIPPSGTVDFWAVGMNCCDPSGLNFRCGDTLNPLARAGIRVLRDDTRAFFLLAVQEWTAWLQMPAKHPLFFHWVQDPLLEVDMFRWNALKFFYLSTLWCAIGSLVGTLILHYICFNLGF